MMGGGIDLVDETQTREVAKIVEDFVGAKEGIRLSVLTGEDWVAALWRSLSPAMRRGAERHIHVLRDKEDPHHLLVSSSAVIGINDRSRVIYAEVVYHTLRCLQTKLSTPLRRGLDDLFAYWIGEILNVDIFTKNFPEERELVQSLLEVVNSQFKSFGHNTVEWAKLLRREPDRFFYALEKSRFASVWLAQAKRSPLNEALLQTEEKKALLVSILRDESLSAASSPLFDITKIAAKDFLQLEAERAAIKSQKSKRKNV